MLDIIMLKKMGYEQLLKVNLLAVENICILCLEKKVVFMIIWRVPVPVWLQPNRWLGLM